MPKNILFYYHHFGGLGHGTRVCSIAQAIKGLCCGFEILVVNSGVPQPELGIGRYAKVINLPPFKAGSGLFTGISSSIDKGLAFKMRDKVLKIITEKFRPDLAIIEHFPLGRDALEDEITRFVRGLKEQNVPVYSSVRDIIVEKYPVKVICRRIGLFEGIFVHSDKRMGLITDFKQPQILKKKMIFTGRVFPVSREELAPRDKILEKIGCRAKKLILVSIGGGIDGIEIIRKVIASKNKIDKKYDTFFMILTGTALDDAEYSKLKRLLTGEKNITIRKFVPDFTSYVNAADLYISMGGYNSVNNALLTGVRTIIFPRACDNEQKIRARYFRASIDIADSRSCLNWLSARITHNLSLGRVKPLRMFNGSIVTARFIERALNLKNLKIRLTTKCDLNCDMCTTRRKKNELDLSRVKQAVDDAGLLNIKTINLTGGEPAVYPDFYRLIRYIKKRGFFLSLSTSGSEDRKAAVRLSRFVDFVDISVHSYNKDIDDEIKGHDGSFKKAADFIKTLKASRNELSLQINVTLRPDNFRDIHRIIPFFAKYINAISFTLVDTSVNRLKRLELTKDEIYSLYFEEIPLIMKECIAAHDIRLKIRPFFKDLPLIDKRADLRSLLSDKERYISEFGSIFGACPVRPCLRAKHDLRINADGNISPCCYLDDYPIGLGNINKNTLLEILSSKTYFDFIMSAETDRGWCKECAAGYKAYPGLLSV